MSTEVHDLIEGTKMVTWSLYTSHTAQGPLLVTAGMAIEQVSSLPNLFIRHVRLFCFVELALSPNNNLVHIYTNQGGKWTLQSVLKEVRCVYFYLMRTITFQLA